MKVSVLARYFYECDDGGKGENEVVDDEDDDVGSSGCTLHTPYFASVVFDVYLLYEGVWVLRYIVKPVHKSQSAFRISEILLL